MSMDNPDQPVKRPGARQSAPAGGGGQGSNSDPAPNDLNLSPGVIAAICGGLLVLTIIVFAVFSGGDDEPSNTTAATGAPTPGAPPSAPKPPARPKVPVGSPEGPATDDFDRADGPVGADWTVLGDWSIVDEQLRMTKPLEGSAQVAVRDMGSADGTVSALARTPSGGQMLVFRYVNPKNYWRIGPVRSYATWGVFRVVDGKARLLENTGLTSTGANTTLTVKLSGPTIAVSVDGIKRVTIEDATHQAATIAGFFATRSGTRGAWDDFYALPAGGAAAPATTAAP